VHLPVAKARSSIPSGFSGSTRAQPATRASLMLFRLACRCRRPRRQLPPHSTGCRVDAKMWTAGRRPLHARARVLPGTSLRCVLLRRLRSKSADFCLKSAILGINAISSATALSRSIGSLWFSTDRKRGPFSGRFGSKIDVSRNKNDTFFCVLAIFRDFCCCKPLPGKS